MSKLSTITFVLFEFIMSINSVLKLFVSSKLFRLLFSQIVIYSISN